ncbi:MAG: alpha/beta hydrolase [Acutalibacteraceae bacterium]
MVIKSSMIDRQLRPIGKLIRLVWPSFSERKFKFCNFILKNFGRGVDVTPWKIKCEQIKIPRADGTKLRLCVYSPRKQKSGVPGLLWLHGGGYAMGIPEQDHAFVRAFVGASGCVMVVPDYKKSLYAPFPAALDDCYLALLWLKNNGERYGMSPDKIFVGGNSAGGGLTAALTIYARDKGEVNVAFQMPLYPMLDDRPTETSRNNDAPVWNTKSNIAAWKLYLGSDYGTDRVSKYAAPSRETDYSGLPPALIFIGSIDPFFAETQKYVNDLRAAGVEVMFEVLDGGFHSFDMYGFADIAKQARNFTAEGFSYAVENYSAPQP